MYLNGLEEEEGEEEEGEGEDGDEVAVAIVRRVQIGEEGEDVFERSGITDGAWKAGDVGECVRRYVNAGIVELSWI